MSNIDSDSDATVADSIDEENVNINSNSSSTEDAEEGHFDSALSLQKKQELLFEKLEKITTNTESTTVQYVQRLQEEYLRLEESLSQLSKIARQERIQLSEKLETASTTGITSGHSFQQQLLQLSDKQKVLLHCFDNQKRLGSQLKLLLSSQNHYRTRSKTLLQQSHSQENVSSGYHGNIKLSSRQMETSKVAVFTTSHSLPVKPVQPVISSIKLPSSSQLTTAVVGQLSKSLLPVAIFNTSKSNLVGISKQQKSVVTVVTKNQQSLSATNFTHENSQQSVGVTTQKQTTPITIQKSQIQQPVSIIPKLQKSVGVATQHQQSVGVATQQQQPVGVATQQQQPVGVTTQQQQSVGTTQPAVVGNNTRQSVNVTTKQQRPVAPRLLLHSELAEPVPLDVLVQHQLISPQDQCLTCTLMGCLFTASLATEGSIINQDGHKFSNPSQWLNDCWSTLGHSKRVDRRTAYNKVNYKDRSLLHYCLIYSQQKVSSYLSRSHDQMSRSHDQVLTNKTTHPTVKADILPEEDTLDITDKCWICPITDQELVLSSKWLPTGFWDCNSSVVLVNNDIENNLNF